jgi:hypothetical protein
MLIHSVKVSNLGIRNAEFAPIALCLVFLHIHIHWHGVYMGCSLLKSLSSERVDIPQDIPKSSSVALYQSAYASISMQFLYTD